MLTFTKGSPPAAQSVLQPQVIPKHHQSDARSGSWAAFTLALIASAGLIFAACATNAGHAYAVGSAESLFRGVVLAVASVGAAVLAPLALMAVGHSKSFGTKGTAFLLALAMFSYTSASSLGFISTAKDADVSGRAAGIEAHADRRRLIEDTRRELASIKGSSRDALDRREDLLSTLASLTTGTPGKTATAKDAQAASLAFYMRQAGYGVTDEAVSVWLTLAMVLTLEFGAALSLSVAAALRPTRLEAPPAAPVLGQPEVPAGPEMPATAPVATPQQGDKDDIDPPAPPKRPRGRGGRPVAILPEAAVEKLRKAGKPNGVRGVAKVLGVSKSTAHRVVHSCAALGLLTLATGPTGLQVALA